MDPIGYANILILVGSGCVLFCFRDVCEYSFLEGGYRCCEHGVFLTEELPPHDAPVDACREFQTVASDWNLDWWNIIPPQETNITIEKQPFEDVQYILLKMVILHCHVRVNHPETWIFVNCSVFLWFLSPFDSSPSKRNKPGDSKWPFYPLVGGHLTFPKGHLTIPERSQRTAGSVISSNHLFQQIYLCFSQCFGLSRSG